MFIVGICIVIFFLLTITLQHYYFGALFHYSLIPGEDDRLDTSVLLGCPSRSDIAILLNFSLHLLCKVIFVKLWLLKYAQFLTYFFYHVISYVVALYTYLCMYIKYIYIYFYSLFSYTILHKNTSSSYSEVTEPNKVANYQVFKCEIIYIRCLNTYDRKLTCYVFNLFEILIYNET